MQDWRDFRALLRGSGRDLAVAAGLSVASGALDIICMIALPVFLVFALSGGSVQRLPEWVLRYGITPSARSLALTIALLFVARGAFALFVGAHLAALSNDIRGRIVARLSAAFARVPFERAATRSIDDAVLAATAHAANFAETGALSLLRLTLDLFTIFMVLVFLLLVEPQFVVGTSVVLLAVAALNLTLLKRANAHHAQVHTALEGRLAHQVTVLLNAPREVRVLQLGDFLRAQIAESMRALRQVRTWFGGVYWLPRVIGELTLIGLAIAFMLREAARGSDAAQVVSNLGVLAYAGIRLLPAFAQCLASVTMARAVQPVAQVLARLLDDPPAPGPVEGAPPPVGPLAEIELRGVGFRYGGAVADALDDVSLRIRAGESIGAVGPSGAGKSTLADLLMGLLPPARGQILVNGEVASLCHPQWWQRVGFVAQVPFIANDTLRNNIAFGTDAASIDSARLERAVRMAQLEGVVASLPRGLDTPLGERGGSLSGGQRQRVAIARALYRHCEFLVLDEATSALDPDTERDVIAAIGALKGQVTLLVIAHRASTLVDCDRILQLRGGKITPAEAPCPTS